MIIGNSLLGMLGVGSNSGHVTPSGRANSGNAAPSSPDAANAHRPASVDSSGDDPAVQSGGIRQSAPNLDPGGPIDLHQTARIMSLVASMRQVDEISAYSLFGRSEGETDEYRHVVSAYKDSAE